MEKKTLIIDSLPGDAVEIPYAHVRGRNGVGPHLTIVAGVHGAEYTGMAAIMRFVSQIDARQLRGTITAVPILNQPAFWSRTAFVVPSDDKNLNRCFPGDPNGSYAEVLAYEIFTNFIKSSDYLLDLHAGDIPESLEPFVLYEESSVEEQSRALARSYGLPYVVRQSRASRTVGGSTSAAAADAGIPAIIAEIGGNGLCDDASVARHLRGLGNVCADLGMLSESAAEPSQPLTECNGWVWMRSPVKGWWQPKVPPGAQVSAGDLLGALLDPFGGVLHQVIAPVDGFPLFVTSSPAVLHDGLLLGLATVGRDGLAATQFS